MASEDRAVTPRQELITKFQEYIGGAAELFDIKMIVNDLCTDLAPYLPLAIPELSHEDNQEYLLEKALDKMSSRGWKKCVGRDIAQGLEELKIWDAYLSICNCLIDRKQGIRIMLSGEQREMIRFICTTKALPYFLSASCHNSLAAKPKKLHTEAKFFSLFFNSITKAIKKRLLDEAEVAKLYEKEYYIEPFDLGAQGISDPLLRLNTYLLLASIRFYSLMNEKGLSSEKGYSFRDCGRIGALLELHLALRILFLRTYKTNGELVKGTGRRFPQLQRYAVHYSYLASMILSALFEKDEERMNDIVYKTIWKRRQLTKFTVERSTDIYRSRLEDYYYDGKLKSNCIDGPPEGLDIFVQNRVTEDISEFRKQFLNIKPQNLHICYLSK